MKTFPCFVSLVLPVLALVGCSHKNTVVGKWQGVITQPNGTMNTSFEFTQDGKENISLQGNMGTMPITMSGTGTYTVNGSTLTQQLTSMTFGTRTVPIPANQAKPQANPFTLDGDHLTLTNPGSKQSLTLTRVK